MRCVYKFIVISFYRTDQHRETICQEAKNYAKGKLAKGDEYHSLCTSMFRKINI